MIDLERQRLLQQKALLTQELHRRLELPLNQYTPDNHPEHNQLGFHQSDARYRCIFGGNQSGKSLAAAAEIAIYLLGKHRFREIADKPKKVYAISAEYRNLFEGVWRHLRPDGKDHNGAGFIPAERIKRMGPKVPGYDLPSFVEVYYGNKPTDNTPWRYSRIDFISADGGESARRRLQSAAVDLAVIDEEIDDETAMEIKVRLLATNGKLIIAATLVRSEEWLIDLENRFEEGDKTVFITRLNTDKNKYLNEQSKADLFGTMSEESKAVRMLGRSKRAFGLVYSSFNTEHVVEPFTIPRDWPRYCCLDPGFRVFAGLWMTHPSGDLNEIYIYHEMYLKETHLSEVADYINNFEGWTYNEQAKRVPLGPDSQTVKRYIDPNAMRKMETGDPCVAFQLAAFYKLPCIPANNSVEGGIEAVRRSLMVNPMTGRPGVRVFSTCRDFLLERRMYKLKSDKSARENDATKDAPVKRKDHLMDSWRYLTVALLGFPQNQIRHARGVSSFQYGAMKMSDRMEQHWKDLESLTNERGKQTCHPYLGTEW